MSAGMRRLNRVQLEIERTVVDVDWQLGLELRERLARAGHDALADRFARVGASRPVRLSREEANVVLALLEEWELQVAGLRAALLRQTTT